MGRLFQPLLFLLACSTEHQLRSQLEFLKAENEMLRKRVPKQRIFLTCVERDRLLNLGTAIGPGVTKLITIVHPSTYQRWIQNRNSGNSGTRIGRLKTLESVRDIIHRIAKETGWGYGRNFGELKKLRIHAIFESTIKNILKDAGMLPRPKKGRGLETSSPGCTQKRSGRLTSSASRSGRPKDCSSASCWHSFMSPCTACIVRLVAFSPTPNEWSGRPKYFSIMPGRPAFASITSLVIAT